MLQSYDVLKIAITNILIHDFPKTTGFNLLTHSNKVFTIEPIQGNCRSVTKGVQFAKRYCQKSKIGYTILYTLAFSEKSGYTIL